MRARLGATRGAEAAKRIKVHTKFVPDLAILRTIERRDVEAIIDRSLRRLRIERLDLVQFHWWDYAVPRWLDAPRWLDELRAGKIGMSAAPISIRHMRAIVEAGIPLASCRCNIRSSTAGPRTALLRLCRAHGIGLLCYGTVAGGFLSDRWLGEPEPHAAREPLARQIQADHRRFRRLGAVPGAAARASPRRRPAGLRHRDGREPRARPSRRRRGDRRRPHARILPPMSRLACSS